MVGNFPNYTKIDILRCFLRFDKNIGRHELARELELGEGTVRTILDILKSKKLLVSTKKGHFLSKKGNEMLNQIYDCIRKPENLKMQNPYPSYKKSGVLVRNILKLSELYKLRDIAVKNRADGAIILTFDDKLYAPEYESEQDYHELEKHFNFKKNDVLVVAFSNEMRHAETGALAIAIELSPFVKKFINEF